MKRDDELKPILVTFKNTDRDRELAKYIRKKSGLATWAKDAMYEKMIRETEDKRQK